MTLPSDNVNPETGTARLPLTAEEQEALIDALVARAEELRGDGGLQYEISEWMYEYAYDLRRGYADGILEIDWHDIEYVREALYYHTNVEDDPLAASLYMRVNNASADPLTSTPIQRIERTAREYDREYYPAPE